MLDNLLKKFLDDRDINTGYEILNFCDVENLPNLGLIISNYMYKVFNNDMKVLLAHSKFSHGMKDYRTCYNIYEKILEFRNLNEKLSSMFILQQLKYITYISDDYISYNPEIVRTILERPVENMQTITFTTTTCKRYDLFEKTINSFLNCCMDLHLIDRWLCVDDNSSEEDREKMKKNYPFFEFYFKGKHDKGHPRSMNIIKNTVKTPYIFNVEDDWKFFKKRNYITECLEVLNQDSRIGQCLINKNYMETEKVPIVGGLFKTTPSGNRYYIHEHCSTIQEHKQFFEKYKGLANCAYWPHFSFRASLFRTKILREIGDFNENSDYFNKNGGHFEMEYANRYKSFNYISAFLEGIYCLHTGRLTSEKNDDTKRNAYDLNDENWYINPNEGKLPKEPPKEGSNDTVIVRPVRDKLQHKLQDKLQHKLQDKPLNIKTYIVNLDKRVDRWEKIQKENSIKFLNYTRFSAIDGSQLVPTEQLQRIFDGNDYNMRQGIVGCALSHIKLYIELINSEYDAFCIFEDDIDFIPNFQDKFLHLYHHLLPIGQWDLCYLGHHVWKQYKTKDFFDGNRIQEIEKWDTATSFKYSMGGTGGYIISKKGAKALLEFINRVGMTNAIDTMQQKAADTLQIYYCKPHLIHSECVTNENKIDTDIQYNYKSLTIEVNEREIEEEKFYSQFGVVDKTTTIPDFDSLKNVTFYKGDDIKNLLTICKLPCYSLNYKVMIIVPYPNKRIIDERWFERLKKNNIYNIDDAIKINKVYKLISLGDNVYVNEAIKTIQKDNVEEYPFDKMEGGDLSSVKDICDKILSSTSDFDIEVFVKDIFNMNFGKVYVDVINNKFFKNIKYNIDFQYNNFEELVPSYIKKFKNFKKVITDKNYNINLVYCTRWNKNKIEDFYDTVDLLRKYNPNIHILSINNIEQDVNIKDCYTKYISKEHVNFPSEFENKECMFKRILYDKSVFFTNIIEIIKKIYFKN
jgi:GR25 family glycosyltransferase involved in LPS biosynthesis